MSTVPGQSAVVHPVDTLRGTLRVPGDKSISHRVAMMSALASGTSVIDGFLLSEDCLNTLGAMEALGARTSISREGRITVRGTAGNLMQPAGTLDMGNSGTGIRLLTGLLAGYPMAVQMTGDASLCSRPMKRIQKPLQMMGAEVDLLGPDGCAPMIVKGGHLKAIEYAMPMASAQVKSCVLLAGLMADGTTTVIEPAPSRDHTERIFQALGLPIHVDGPRVSIEGSGGAPVVPVARDWVVPGDISSAAFFIAAAAGREGAELVIEGVGLNPRRTALLDVLRRMGAHIEITPRSVPEGEEPIGDLRITGARLQGTEIGGEEIPSLIDEIPILSVMGAVAEGKTVVRDAAELRVKESDRISVMVENLRRVGVTVEEQEDGMIIHGPTALKTETRVNSYGDHRVAMAMSILALYGDKPLCVNNVACVATSYPTFWENLRSTGADVEW
ncbi:MAG: 3-phosphoshikimate 1-carboxyvinyltransferase [Spartobacteria bacterium]|nr:3-phosphoshikimate 1-carboxyvinyltransferase [Spartobacteria bacterium]